MGCPSPTPDVALARTLAWLDNFLRHRNPVVAQVAGRRVVVWRGGGATCSCGAAAGRCSHVAAARAEWGVR